jgi:hypothetical protein
MRQFVNQFATILASVFGLCLTAAAQETTAPTPRDAKSDKTTTAAKSGADSESARKLLDELKTKLGQDPKKLAELARERGRQALAEFQYGPLVAKAQARERRQEEKRIELRTRAERATEERGLLRKRLDEEIEQIRRQFSDDKPECDRQLALVLNAYAPRLQELKEEAQHSTELAETTTKKLADLRREGLGLEQQRKQRAQGYTSKSSRQLLVDKALLDDNDDEPLPATNNNVADNTPLKSADELLKEIDQ